MKWITGFRTIIARCVTAMRQTDGEEGGAEALVDEATIGEFESSWGALAGALAPLCRALKRTTLFTAEEKTEAIEAAGAYQVAMRRLLSGASGDEVGGGGEDVLELDGRRAARLDADRPLRLGRQRVAA